ncbi:hypothetical protein EI94DRAFT_425473 [Lactarius quietus]|nr:hypothetical protein EI94DRAFT_425473 [Lactarius quietus]
MLVPWPMRYTRCSNPRPSLLEREHAPQTCPRWHRGARPVGQLVSIALHPTLCSITFLDDHFSDAPTERTCNGHPLPPSGGADASVYVSEVHAGAGSLQSVISGMSTCSRYLSHQLITTFDLQVWPRCSNPLTYIPSPDAFFEVLADVLAAPAHRPNSTWRTTSRWCSFSPPWCHSQRSEQRESSRLLVPCPARGARCCAAPPRVSYPRTASHGLLRTHERVSREYRRD